MSNRHSKLSTLLSVLPAILLLTFANVFISFTSAAVVLIQLIANGANKYVALIVAIMVAVSIHLYIAFNHKLRNYIKKQGESHE